MRKQSNTLNFKGQNIYVGICAFEELDSKYPERASPPQDIRSAPESGSPVLLSSRAFSQRELSVSL